MAPISSQECDTCSTAGQLDKMVSNVDNLTKTLINLQRDVFSLMNSLPKKGSVPVVQKGLTTVKRPLRNPDNRDTPTGDPNFKCPQVPQGASLLGLYRRKTYSQPKVYKVMKKISDA